MQDDFAAEASRPPSGFTQTDEDGRILADDEDDWRTSPLYRGRVVVDPAYPNPTPIGGFVTIPIRVTAFEAVRAPLSVRAWREGRLTTLSVINRAADPGFYTFSFSAALVGATGLQRLFIFDAAGELVSYGDLMIE